MNPNPEITPQQVTEWLRGKAQALSRAGTTKRRTDPDDRDGYAYAIAAAHIADLADELERAAGR